MTAPVDLLAHGGVAGAVIELSLVVGAGAFFLAAAWLERRKPPEERRQAALRDDDER